MRVYVPVSTYSVSLAGAGADTTCTVAGDTTTVRCYGPNDNFQTNDQTLLNIQSFTMSSRTTYVTTCTSCPTRSFMMWGHLGNAGIYSTPNFIRGEVNFGGFVAGDRHDCRIVVIPAASGFPEGRILQCFSLESGNLDGRLGPDCIQSINKEDCTWPGAIGNLYYKYVAAGYRYTCTAFRGGSDSLVRLLTCVGANTYGGAIGGGEWLAPPGSSSVEWTGLCAGDHHTCGLVTGGIVYCWGLNNEGQLGDGTQTNRAAFTQVNTGVSFASIQCGGYHTCASTFANFQTQVYCWGMNQFGQLGIGSNTRALTPVAVTNLYVNYLSGGVQYSGLLYLGRYHSCASFSGGRFTCWGRNNYGQLADGLRADKNSFVIPP